MIIEFLTSMLVLVTGFYAWVTFRIMRANEATVATVINQTDALTRPYVTVGVVTFPNNYVLYLRISNTGKTGADDVRLTLDRDFYQFGVTSNRNLRDMSAFQQPIAQLPPGAEIIFALASAVSLFAPNADAAVIPQVFEVSASYRYGERRVTEKSIIDVRPYFMSVDRPDAMITEVQGVRKELEKIAKK